VGHPEESLSDVRRPDARSAQIGGPDGIAQSFQVSAYSGEPCAASRARNLFAKCDCSFAEGDEVAEDGPEVALVFFAETFARAGEWLAGAGTCPNRSRVGPAGEPQGKGPTTDAGEEVLLGVTGDFMGADVGDAALVDITGRDVAGADEFAEPCRGAAVVFVVVGRQGKFWILEF